jgi:hypothetical protein
MFASYVGLRRSQCARCKRKPDKFGLENIIHAVVDVCVVRKFAEKSMHKMQKKARDSITLAKSVVQLATVGCTPHHLWAVRLTIFHWRTVRLNRFHWAAKFADFLITFYWSSI